MVKKLSNNKIALLSKSKKLYTEIQDLLGSDFNISAFDDHIKGIDAGVIFLDVDTAGINHLYKLKDDHFVIVVTAQKGSRYLIEAMTFGAFDCLISPFERQQLVGTVKSAISIQQELKGKKMEFPGDIEGSSITCAIVGDSPVLQEVCKTIGQVGRVDVPVLITGESGTGKDLVAESIWKVSRRWEKPFVIINCAAIPDSLLEAELFGHEKGAFTGAETNRKGKFEEADGGTIFLDEIGDMSLSLQAKLLRVLQNQSFQKLGSNKEVEVNVRVITATNKDLEKLVEQDLFRGDLYYRLNVVEINLPSLHERKEDIPLLTQCFARRHSAQAGKDIKGFSSKYIEELMEYDWPGNIRELENTVRKSIALSKTNYLTSYDLKLPANKRPNAEDNLIQPQDEIESIVSSKIELSEGSEENLYSDTIKEVERSLIEQALSQTKWNRSKAARMLGINRITLRRKIEEFDISFPNN
ncbi:MAG: sigma-54-dependent Fis family transcriptional regulator [Candidatus Dadabacteria bacterium]|nr:sigma-54-dependent Fis family transcriptional regulator [Candidatus Dadabacteria bacterium]NIS07562.1 sigma-54-dependent Fis family transcriptional regulator [Candidatus Dadabacteria bacterium]NIY21177.1 AAA family ATPase [Candidatus Dadabacteria bacterium]